MSCEELQLNEENMFCLELRSLPTLLSSIVETFTHSDLAFSSSASRVEIYSLTTTMLPVSPRCGVDYKLQCWEHPSLCKIIRYSMILIWLTLEGSAH